MPTGVYPRSKQHRERLSKIYKGRIITWGAKISQNRKGKGLGKLSEEHRLHISLAGKGKKKPIGFNMGRKHSDKTREKMSRTAKARRESMWNWKGGITPLINALRATSKYKLWRESVFTRDKHTCQMCGNVGGKLNADHILSFTHYPESRYEVDNGRALCIVCHRKTENYGGKAIKRTLSPS